MKKKNPFLSKGEQKVIMFLVPFFIMMGIAFLVAVKLNIAKWNLMYLEMLIAGIILWITAFLLGRILFLDDQKRKDAKTVDIRSLDRSEPIPLSEVKFWFKQSGFGKNIFENSMIRLDRILDSGFVPEMYINYALGYFMPNKDLDENELERAYLSDIHVKSYPCVKCGGISLLAARQEKICAYCQSQLPDYYGKSVIEGERNLERIKGLQATKVKKRSIGLFLTGSLYLLLALFLYVAGIANLWKKKEDDFLLVSLVIIFLIASGMLIISLKAFRAWTVKFGALKDYPVIEGLIQKEGGPVSIKQLADIWKVDEHKAYKRADQVIDCRLLPDMYLNETIQYLLFTDHIKNGKLQYAYLEKYGSERFVCKKCGGESILKRHQNRICPYCGNPLRFFP